jgi:hypothetical protein
MSETYTCIECNYKTKKKGNYMRHIKTKKHLDKKSKYEIYKCPLCNYITNRKNNYVRHKNTFIHKDNVLIQNNNIISEEGGSYELKYSLDKILKEQESIKNMIPKECGNTIINNKLSINVYLNTQCKEAMSIEDFMNQLNISLEDLKYTQHKGFVQGISNVFVKQLADLDPKERPIHCSDKKRLQFYIKNTNSWEKDDNNKNINKAIGSVQKKQIELLYLWDEKHPGWESNEKLIMERLNIAKSIYGSTNNNERDRENKQIKKIIGENIELDISIDNK